MNISKRDQRVLHVLALGGEIRCYRNENGKINDIICYTRDGYVLSNFTDEIFKPLKSKKLISSKNSAPYRITQLGARRLSENSARSEDGSKLRIKISFCEVNSGAICRTKRNF
ncbi:YjhX family toxin [Endozoicomonas sp. GU-1]|uniref:YjhX family toxin n=1 Tax=Endozoicomonas sp. GU-1 TaxID=3009078 RepID=UPI0022B4240D|nr:YjhX family toxin [Endozoicomonas sp. GU-1]WBA84678.1 hypothetical protein O3276_15465 [Endozoicomonas sp. GU-1]